MSTNRVRAHAKVTAIAMALFIGTLALTIVLTVSLRSTSVPVVIGRILFPAFVILQFAVPWFLMKLLKRRFDLGVEHPENAVGGMAVGFALVSWVNVALAAQNEFVKPPAFGLQPFFVALLAMSIASWLALAVLRRDRSIFLALISPVVAAAAFILIAYSLPDPETTISVPYNPVMNRRAKMIAVREGPRKGRRIPATDANSK